MAQAFRDQINDTNSKREHITLWLKVFVDIIRNAFQERVNQFSIANHPAFADVLWILGFRLLYVFTERWWISYGQSIFLPWRILHLADPTWTYIALSAVKGFLIGLSQWVFIRKYIRVNWAWPFVTGIFVSIGGFLSGGIDYFLFSNPDKFRFLCEFYYQGNFHSTVQQYLFPIITVYFISLSQVAFLPKSRFRWLWIPVSLIASLVEKYSKNILIWSLLPGGTFQ